MTVASGEAGSVSWPAEGQGQARVSILEGTTVQPTPAVAGSPFTGQPMRAVLQDVRRDPLRR